MASHDDSVVDSLIALQNAGDENNDSANSDKEDPANVQKLNVMLCTPTEDLTISRKNDQGGDEYNLYVTNEIFDQIISNVSNDDTNKDVYLSCQEVETKDGKLFMMTADAVDGVICSTSNDENNHASNFAAPLDSLIKIDENGDETKKELPIHYIEETILSSDVLEKEADELLCSEQLSSKANHCMLCDCSFKTNESYHEHYTKLHLNTNSDKSTIVLHCFDCRETFKKVSSFMEHKVNVHGNSDNICTICGELLSTIRSLSNHLKSHFNKQSYTCNTCGRSFRNQQSRQDHIKNKHLKPKDTVFACKYCDSTFQHGRSLVRHINSIHSKKRVTCSKCKKSYSSISSLYYHQRTIHGNVAFHCGYCTAVFKSVSSIKKHENEVHHNVARYRETPTEKVYSYNQLVTNNVDSLKMKKTKTNLITCVFCKTKHKSHEQYAKHFNKFHKEENLDFTLLTDQNSSLQNTVNSSSSLEPWV